MFSETHYVYCTCYGDLIYIHVCRIYWSRSRVYMLSFCWFHSYMHVLFISFPLILFIHICSHWICANMYICSVLVILVLIHLYLCAANFIFDLLIHVDSVNLIFCWFCSYIYALIKFSVTCVYVHFLDLSSDSFIYIFCWSQFLFNSTCMFCWSHSYTYICSF